MSERREDKTLNSTLYSKHPQSQVTEFLYILWESSKYTIESIPLSPYLDQ